MVTTETPRPITLSDVIGISKAKILAGLQHDEQIYFQKLLAARIARREGNKAAWEQFSRDEDIQKIAEGLRVKKEGREVIELIQKAFPIPDSGNPFVKRSVFDMHGEIKLGEVTNLEGV